MMHIESLKYRTKEEPILSLPDPLLLRVPLEARFGSRIAPAVSVGDEVAKFQVIGRAEKEGSPQVHAPVSGIVREIGEIGLADGSKVQAVVIENDFRERTATTAEPHESLTAEKLLDWLDKMGVVGEGGAQFPAAKKYNTRGKPVEYLIINGAECEPFLTGDYALMSQRTEEFFQGIRIVDSLLNPGHIVIAVEEQNVGLAAIFGLWLRRPEYARVSLQIVPDEYPQGGELQLARSVTGREIPKGTVPLERGVIVSNVGTICAVCQAVEEHRPVIDRVLTISGEEMARPGNYRVRIGTPFRHILECCGIDPGKSLVVAGGPMMSPHVTDFEAPVTKGTLGVVALRYYEPERLNCIWCGYCADVCPMNLMPMKYAEFHRTGKYGRMRDYDLEDCIDCASCEYICPSKVALMESIKAGKKKLKEMAHGDK